MPCRTDWYCEDCKSYHCNDLNYCPNSKTKEISNEKELPITYDMFFEAFYILEDENLLIHVSDEVKNFHKNIISLHKRKIAYEAAYSKLTLEERKALNIDLEVLKHSLITEEKSLNKKYSLTINMLCEICSVLENFELLSNISSKTYKWYNNHCLLEKYKTAYEAAEKLTIKERQALGINMLELKLKKDSLL